MWRLVDYRQSSSNGASSAWTDTHALSQVISAIMNSADAEVESTEDMTSGADTSMAVVSVAMYVTHYHNHINASKIGQNGTPEYE